MKQYALVRIGTSALYPGIEEEVEGFYETPEQLKEAFDKDVDFGPIFDWKFDKYAKCTFYASANYYAVEFEGEEVPDEEYFIDFVSGYLDEYIDELDEDDKPKGNFKLIFSSEENSGFTDFKKVFDRKEDYYNNSTFYNPTLEHAIEFYQAHHLFSESIMNNIDNSTDELDNSGIDYESCPSDYHFCDFVDTEGNIIAEKLEAVKAEQGRD